MALQSSGTIKFSQLGAELNRDTSEPISMRDAASGAYEAINTASSSFPNSTTPHNISEWYGYDHNASSVTPSDYYWLGDGVNDTLRATGSSAFNWSTTNDFTWSGWYRLDATNRGVEQLGSISKSSPSGNDQIFLQYHGGQNRIYLRVRVGGTFGQRQYPLHDNLTTTGVSSAGWKSTNRGNVNSDGFVHLTFTYDASDTSSNAFQVYWNGTKLTSSVNNQSGTRSSSWSAGSIAVGDIISSATNNSNVFQGGIDQVAIYKAVLSQSNITALYNSGVPITCSDAGVTSNIMAEYRLENNSTNTSGPLPNLSNNNGGTFQTY